MTSTKKRPVLKNPTRIGLVLSILFSVSLVSGAYILSFEKKYEQSIYPNVTIGGIPVGGNTVQQATEKITQLNSPIQSTVFTLINGEPLATISATELSAGYDTQMAATQAYLIGRSPHVLSNIREKFFLRSIDVPLTITWNKEYFSTVVENVRAIIDVPVQNGLFTFENGKVTAFRPSKDGISLDDHILLERLEEAIATAIRIHPKEIAIAIPTQIISPSVTTDGANSFGIKERIGRGYSEFSGSIPGRIHNVALGASRVNGVLIPPKSTFSFNDVIGDISAATGYQSAYIIKNGRTVLGDGGGICQVSTTLFRAALDAGLPIVERHEHSYRVHYYEEGGYKPGLDATVFSPTEDLKFINNTPSHILIQTYVDTQNLTATFDLFGTYDGRKAQIYDHQVWGIAPPPPPLYQDDPTLPIGVERQVDFSSWGAKASFKYIVTKNEEVLTQQDFYSNYQPWQAVFLRGTKQ